jgi:hypothetical protein
MNPPPLNVYGNTHTGASAIKEAYFGSVWGEEVCEGATDYEVSGQWRFD